VSKKNIVVIDGPHFTKSNILHFRLEREGQFKRAVGPQFFCEYNCDIDKVPTSLLNITILGTVLPIAWAIDGEVLIDQVDRQFYENLPKLREAIKTLYPNLTLKGTFTPENIISNEIKCDPDKSMSLFTGGIDSTATFINQKSSVSHVVTIWGGDVPLSKKYAWDILLNKVSEFVQSNNVTSFTIKSNFASNEFIKLNYLNYRFRNVLHNWGIDIQQSIGMLSLCAPLSFISKSSIIYIAATHTKDFSEPWGSHPCIDNNMKWSGTHCLHDGYELSRVDKIKLIARKMPNLKVRVCSKGPKGKNCGHCEKCSRTIVGFLVAGADPNDHGLIATKETLLQIRKSLENGKFRLKANEYFMWHDIQYHTSNRPPVEFDGADEFFDWFSNTEIEHLISQSDRSHRFPDKVNQIAELILPQHVQTVIRDTYKWLFRLA